MPNKFEIVKKYKAKSYLECGYNFPEGEYKIKEISDGFPTNPHKNKIELKSAKEQWLEGFEDDQKEYKKLYNDTWYCLDFPEKDHYEWVPEVVMKEAFEKLNIRD